MINIRQYNDITRIHISNNTRLSTNDFSNAFNSMTNLKSLYISNNVDIANMSYMCYNCTNLTGSPVCGENVTNMSYAYYNCRNLTGTPVCGEKVTNMSGTYSYCPNLYGNAYFYSSNISNATNCFYGRNISNMLNIYCPINSKTMNTLLFNSTRSLVGVSITWTNDFSTNGCYYNTTYNICIYPVENVSIERKNNND